MRVHGQNDVLDDAPPKSGAQQLESDSYSVALVILLCINQYLQEKKSSFTFSNHDDTMTPEMNLNPFTRSRDRVLKQY